MFNAIGGISWVSLCSCWWATLQAVPFVQEHSRSSSSASWPSVAPAVIGAVKAALNGRKKKA